MEGGGIRKGQRLAAAEFQVELVTDVRIPMSFFEQMATAMAMIREDGMLLFSNQAAVRTFGSVPGRSIAAPGEFIQDFEPKAFFEERVEIMRRLARNREDGIIRDLWQGEQILTHLRLLPATPHQTLRSFLSIHQRTSGAQGPEQYEGMAFHEGEVQDLGELALLSPRELEVLALVGEGMTASQIAAIIHRTEDTVNSHRASLLRKLRCQNAVQLSVIAQRAGLKFDDGSRLGS